MGEAKKLYRIALLGGEGIGPEVVEATARVVAELIDVSYARPLHGEEAIASAGSAIPDSTKAVIQAQDAVLFGATWKHCGDVLRFLRWGLDAYANIRPARTRPNLPGPLRSSDPIDLVIVRENLEGEYPTREGALEAFNERWPGFQDILGRSMPEKGFFGLRIATETSARRIAKVAVAEARARQARGAGSKVSVVTKKNVLKRTDGLFHDVCASVLDEAGLEHEHFFVDDAARRLVAMPAYFDVILTPNLFGDVLSDVAAETVGGLGMAPSGCMGDEYSYFESVHGSAPDIMGQGIANPLATVLAAVMMLRHLNEAQAADRLDRAVDRMLVDGRVLPPDLGGSARTDAVADELIRILHEDG